MIVYKLRSENLTNLGGRMGTEYTFDNWSKLFNNIADAKKHAEKDYGKPIEWKENSNGNVSSGDLSYVMYIIEPTKVE